MVQLNDKPNTMSINLNDAHTHTLYIARKLAYGDAPQDTIL